MKTTNQTEIRLKDGTTFPVGTPCVITFALGSTVVTVAAPMRDFKVRCAQLPHYFKAFKKPSLSTMERWSNDGVAKTVTGDRTEPDGYGPDGAPSWLLALGLI